MSAYMNDRLDAHHGHHGHHHHHHHHHHHPHPYSDEGYPYPAGVFPGLAWACTRPAWDAVGGLVDFAVWGGGDWHMAHALTERVQGMMRNDLHHDIRSW